jgi:drug/metabolite transporter (DMT)-like permease
MGELIAVLSAVCFAASNVTIARGAGAGKDNGAFLSILITLAIAGVLWVSHGIHAGWPQMNAAGLAWYAGAGVLTNFIGRVFLYASVQHVGAIRASAVKRLNPLFSVLLGVLILGDPFDSRMTIGMLLIFSSFGVLIWQSLRGAERGSAAQSMVANLTSLGYLYGPVSALAYAVGYVARKQGMALIPDPAFGTMLGSAIGAVAFVLTGQFVDSYRRAMRDAFSGFKPLLFAAGVLSSMGQILYFVALNYSTVSRVALITSMEAIVTVFLTVVVLRSRENLNASVLLAVGLGMAGTAFIILH